MYIQPIKTGLKMGIEKYKFKGFSSFMETFHDDNSCRKFLEYLLWEGKPICPYCIKFIP